MTEFAEDFRAEIEEHYGYVLNGKNDDLRKASLQGLGALMDYAQRHIVRDLVYALEMANPGDIEYSCARGALTLLMIRDATHAMQKAFSNAFDGPKEERDAAIKRIMEDQFRRRYDVELPDAGFTTQLQEIAQASERSVDIHVSSLRVTVTVKNHFDRENPQEFKGENLVDVVREVHQAIIEKPRAEKTAGERRMITYAEFLVRTRPLTRDEREDIAFSIQLTARSPLWDRPSTPDDQLRRHAMLRAHSIAVGLRLIPESQLVMRAAGPTLLMPDWDPQPLYYPRGGRP